MKASEYLTRPDLGLTKSQIECVTQLASICGIDSMFEGLSFGGMSKPSIRKTVAKTDDDTNYKSIFGKEAADPEGIDTILGKENYSRSSQSADDITRSIDDPSTDITDPDAFANQAGEDAEKESQIAPTDRLIEELVDTISKIYGLDPMGVNEYLANSDKASQFVDSYIDDMATNLRSTNGDDIANRLTGGQNSATEVTVQNLKRLLQIYMNRKISADKESDVAKAIADVVGAIDNGAKWFDEKSLNGYGQSDTNEQVMKSILGEPTGQTVGKARDRMNMLQKATLQKLLARKRQLA